MCTQTYYTNKRTRQSKICPYPDLYSYWNDSIPKNLKLVHKIDLPHDDTGKCIFHSNKAVWKKKYHFSERFNDLITLVNQDKRLKEIDFRAFIFTGGNQNQNNIFMFSNLTFDHSLKFDAVQFKKPVIFKDLSFNSSSSFIDMTFQESVRFENCTINGASFDKTVFNAPVYFFNTTFSSYTTFIGVKFLNGLKIIQTVFKHLVYFENALFTVKNLYSSKITFRESTFESTTFFSRSTFECAVVFESVVFGNKIDFIDTQFNLKQTIDALDSALVFNDFILKDTGVLNFTSTDPLNKLFKGEVSFRYEEKDLQGLIQFENANFHHIGEGSKKALQVSEKLGKVDIGKGCIKYRFQSERKTISIVPENQRFIIEITQVFANYFSNHHGLNLGIEILERSKESITYFFFSDENISNENFNLRMQESEYGLWELLFIDKNNFLEKGQELVKRDHLDRSAFINTIDSIAALVSILFRLKNRSDFGLWTQVDTESFVKAINHNQPLVFKIENFHNSLIENFHQKTLFDLSSSLKQNIKNQINLTGKKSTYINKKVDKGLDKK